MLEQRRAWLLRCAGKLTEACSVERPINLLDILAKCNVQVELRSKRDLSADGGSVERTTEGKLRIALETGVFKPELLGTRDRFTIAHELGHILLIQKFNWTPSHGSDFFHCEELCNEFASNLLVPERVFKINSISTAMQLFNLFEIISSHMGVSWKVAARRVVARYHATGVILGTRTSNRQGADIIFIKSGYGQIGPLKIANSMHLLEDQEPARTLFEQWHLFSSDRVSVVDTAWGSLGGKRAILPNYRLIACAGTSPS
jgi:hypothetical protein